MISPQEIETNERILKASINVFIESILRIVQNDPHQWSNRPCESCRTISSIIDKPFGCYKYMVEHNK